MRQHRADAHHRAEERLAGGAQALGRDAGAIRQGAWADLVALEGSSLHLQGLSGDRLLDAWTFAGDDRVVRDVWSAGRHVVHEGRHVARDQVEARFRNVVGRLRDL